MNPIKTQNNQMKMKTSDKVKYSGRIFTTTFKSLQPKKASPVQVPKKMNILQSCSHKPGGGPLLSFNTAKTSKGPVNGQMDDFCTRKLYC